MIFRRAGYLALLMLPVLPARFALGDAVWQWSVPAPTIPDRRAFLCIPDDCNRVRGLVVACQNMLEQPLFERPAFRVACAENNLGLLLIFSGHDNTPILYRVNSGALIQVGPDPFRIRPHAGPIGPRGNPWEPTLVAYNLGDDEYRPTERPAHVNVNIINTKGESQTIDFPQIADRPAGSTGPIPLKATASSGLPVDYFVISGPVTLSANGKSLITVPVPPRTKYPMRVLIGAFQWGRSISPQVRSTGPVVRQFFIVKQ